jgi:hypothetical protein
MVCLSFPFWWRWWRKVTSWCPIGIPFCTHFDWWWHFIQSISLHTMTVYLVSSTQIWTIYKTAWILTCNIWWHQSKISSNISQENQEISILEIKKAKTRLKVLIEVKDKLPNKALQNWEERTIRQGQEKNKKTKNTHVKYEQKWQSLACSGTINSNM